MHYEGPYEIGEALREALRPTSPCGTLSAARVNVYSTELYHVLHL